MTISDRMSARIGLVLFLGVATVGAQSRPVTPEPQTAPAELVGRWALVAVIRDSRDVTLNGLTQGNSPAIYDFKRDGTFTIAIGDSVAETGTWSANAQVTPKIFDHIPNLPNGRRPRVPGIYEVGGGALKICLLPASEADTHPTACEARGGDRSSMYILTRAEKQP